jgi:hypothetical protein
MSVDGATRREMPSDVKIRTRPEAENLRVSGQSDVDIYIIETHLKYIPSTTTIHSLWVELDAGEFPKMRNGN